MVYRKAELADAAEAARMYRALALHIRDSSGDPYWGFGDLPVEVAIEPITGYIQGAESCIYLAEENGKPVGMIILEVIPCHMPLSPYPRVGYIAAGYVKEEYRRRGIMKELEKRSHDFFRELGIEYVEVNYLPDNPGAKENWNALGYRCFREQARKRI